VGEPLGRGDFLRYARSDLLSPLAADLVPPASMPPGTRIRRSEKHPVPGSLRRCWTPMLIPFAKKRGCQSGTSAGGCFPAGGWREATSSVSAVDGWGCEGAVGSLWESPGRGIFLRYARSDLLSPLAADLVPSASMPLGTRIRRSEKHPVPGYLRWRRSLLLFTFGEGTTFGGSGRLFLMWVGEVFRDAEELVRLWKKVQM